MNHSKLLISNMMAKRLLLIGTLIYLLSSLVSMAVMSVGFAFFCFTFLFYFLSRKQMPESPFPELKTYMILSALLSLAIIASLLYLQLVPTGISPRILVPDWGQGLSKLMYFLIPLLIAMVWKVFDASEKKILLQSYFYFSLLLSLIGVQQYFTSWPRHQEIPDHLGRFHSTLFLGHHLATASVFIFPFFLSGELLLKKELREKLNIGFFLVFLSVVASGLTLIFTYSRTLWIALPIGIVVFLILKLQKWKALGLVLSIVLLGNFFYKTEEVQSRLNDGRGLSDRSILWKANIEFFKERPVFGVGFRKNGDLSGPYLNYQNKHHTDPYIFAGNAHNNLLEMLSGTGLVGVIAFVLWQLFILKESFQKGWLERKKGIVGVFGVSLFCSFVVFQINGLTQVNFWDGKCLHTFMIWATFAVIPFFGPLTDERLKNV